MTDNSPGVSREPSRKRWWDYFFTVLTSLTIDLLKWTPAALVAIFTFVNSNYQFATLQQISWFVVCLTYTSTIAAVLIIARILRLNILTRLRRLYKGTGIRYTVLLSLKLIGSLATPIAFVVAITPLISSKSPTSYDAQKLFPQAADMGPVFIRTYASNGEAYYAFFGETPPLGPDGYVSITLRNYGTTGEHNSGWVFFFLRGADLSRYKEMRFLIRGETGLEKIGIRAKDARGIEVSLILDAGTYLRTQTLTTQWQEVTIPFTHFGNVDFGLVDNFSFYTRGDMSRTVPQTFYVGGFRLLP